MLKRILSVIGASAMVASAAFAQSGTTVSGRVTNDAGAPIAGANVFVPSLNIGAQTNDAGRYTFVVLGNRAAGQTVALTARVIGFTSKSAQVTLTSGRDIVENFVLSSNPLRLGEVVVTGAGTSTTREKLGVTINTVDSASIRRAATPQNLVSSLAGKAPGVVVRTQSGEPGASASIKIRGGASLSGTNQPLFVVDGVPIDNSTSSTMGGDASTVTQNRAADINPDDIQSVDILKGSAAAAIYGARAANGVVLITTKSGHAGPTRYSFTTQSNIDNIDTGNLQLQRDYAQGSSGKTAVCGGPNCALNSNSYGAKIPAGTATYDHLNELYGSGTTFDNNLSISGGSDRTTFYASGGITNQNGVLVGPENKYNRGSFRLKGTDQVTQNFDVGGNFDFVDTRGNYVQKGSNVSGVLLGGLRTPPNFNNLPYLNQFGLQRPYRFPNPTDVPSMEAAGYYDNPFFVLNSPGNKSELNREIPSFNANWRPTGWLTVNETLGADSYADSRLEALPVTSAGNAVGQVTRRDENFLQIDHNLTATATHSFTDRISGTLTLGQNLNSRRDKSLFSTGNQFLAAMPLALQNTVSQTSGQGESLAHIESYFAQATSEFYDQLYFTVGLRNDGFSTFGASNRRANFPKASAAWTFTNAFGNHDQKGLLSYGKLRAAYGETGKEPPVYGTITAFSTSSTFGSGYGDNINTLFGPGGIVSSGGQGNDALRPERSKEFEFGGDFGFFNQRADLSVTSYNKHTSDVIINVPTSAAATGYTSKLENGAKLSNRGIEISANIRAIETQNASLEFGVQYAKNKGSVDGLLGAQFITYGNEGFTGAIGSATLGYAPGVLRGSDFIRCGRGLKLDLGAGIQDVDAICAATPGGYKAGALYLAANGLPVPDPTDRVIADPNPKYTMSYTTSLKLWNKLTFSGLLDLRKGGQVWNGTRGVLITKGTSAFTDVRGTTNGQFGVNFYTDLYPNVAGPGVGVVPFTSLSKWQGWFQGNGGGFGPVGQQFVEDGSFVKLRELSLTYTLDAAWVRNLVGFTSADIRVAGRNLHTWTKYKGLDPEANLGGAEFLTQGIDYFNSPQTKSFVIAISLNR
ncbi:MAG: SusC/RagA family TonB-linked outer membrane protein [Gemmatimonadota bacterium]|nr:SusC/RagA family TonB-linked outer membrane protein [Gemmatimonadota bacterium]